MSSGDNNNNNNNNNNVDASVASEKSGGVIQLAPPSLDLVFDDAMLEEVKSVWQRVIHDPDGQGAVDGAAAEFMAFEDRQEPTEEMNGDGDD